MTAAFFILAGLVAASDWFAVGWRDGALDRAARPAVMAALLLAVISGGFGTSKPWLIAALAFSLIADVALQRSAERGIDRALVAAVIGYALALLAYVVAFARHAVHPWLAALGVLVAGCVAMALWRHVLVDASRRGPRFAVSVAAFVLLLAATVVSGFATGSVAAAFGVAFLAAAFSTLGWIRLRQPLLRGSGIFVVTYHAGQVLTVLGLLT